MKELLFFDLDGTLTDSEEGITKCVAYALAEQGITEQSQQALRRFIGPPLVDSFQSFYGMDLEHAKQATSKYRERYSTVGLFENRLYDGIPHLLAALKQAAKRLFMVTSKPEPYAQRIAEHFGIADYFEFICGATLDGRINHKDAVVALALERLGHPDVSTVEMVGDRRHDVEGARKNGVTCTYVLYGFGSRAEAEDCRAAHIAESVEELEQFLLEL